MAKSKGQAGPTRILKFDEDRRLVFGWATVAIRKTGEVVEDGEGDVVEPEEMEDAAYEFNLHFRELNERHRGLSKGRLVESLAVTPDKLEKMGLPRDALPVGVWVGFYVEDDGAWEGVKSGKYKMFSIEGTAEREAI